MIKITKIADISSINNEQHRNGLIQLLSGYLCSNEFIEAPVNISYLDNISDLELQGELLTKLALNLSVIFHMAEENVYEIVTQTTEESEVFFIPTENLNEEIKDSMKSVGATELLNFTHRCTG